jgi:uncharacterized alpha-E superfamily protein
MLLARMAESIYWSGRYLERAESTARIVQVHTDAHMDLPVGEDVGWEPLLAIAGTAGDGDGAHGREGDGSGAVVEHDAVHYVLCAPENPSSVLASLEAARANLRTARPAVPREVWEACHGLWLASSEHRSETSTRDGRVQWLRRVVAGCQGIAGILAGTMSRDEAQSFFAIGRSLERAELTTRVLDARSANLQPHRGDDPYEAVRWMAVLRSLAAYQPFRRAMPARPQGGATLRFLLQDDRFPRAVSACLSDVRSQLKQLPGTEEPADACTTAALLVSAAPVSRLALRGLDEFLERVRLAVVEVHLAIESTYFRPPLARWPAAAPAQ